MRKTLQIGVSVALLVMLAGMAVCGAKTVTIGTWLMPEIFKKAYSGQLQVFSETHPEIELEVINVASWGEFAKKVILLAAVGDLPDILQIPPEQLAPLAESGILEDLGPLPARRSRTGSDSACLFILVSETNREG